MKESYSTWENNYSEVKECRSLRDNKPNFNIIFVILKLLYMYLLLDFISLKLDTVKAPSGSSLLWNFKRGKSLSELSQKERN